MKYVGAILVLCPILLFSQVESSKQRFSVPYAKGCAPYSVNIQEIVDFGDTIAIQYIYDESGTLTLDTFHTYTEPGFYEIIQFVGLGGAASEDEKLDTLTIEVTLNTEPSFDLFYCENNQVYIEITDDVYDYYIVEYEGGANEQLNQNETSSYTYATGGIKNISLTGYFNNGAPNCKPKTQGIELKDPGIEATIQDAIFDRICQNSSTLSISYISDLQQYYQIEIKEDQGNYEVKYEGKLDSTLINLDSLEINTLSQEICIRVNAVSPCSQQVSNGDPFCVTIDPSTFSSIRNAYATNGSEGMVINFESENSGNYILSRKKGKQAYALIDTIESGFIDRSISPYRSYDYLIAYIDQCDLLVEEVFISPPSIDKTELKKNIFEIDWDQPTSTIQTEPTYQFIMKDLNDSSNYLTYENPTNPMTLALNETLGKRQVIQLEAKYSDLGISSFSNYLVEPFEHIIHIPSAFSPDGDGLNDELVLFNPPDNFLKMNIYNRWGKIIQQMNSADESWDGKIGTSDAKEGTYMYTIEFLDSGGQKTIQRGSFVLIRKN